MDILLSNELLDCVDGDRLIDGATCAGVLAAAVAHAPAYSREWVLAFDEFQCFCVLSFGSFLEVSLNGNMCRTRCLARCRARRVAVYAILVTIVLCPFVWPPFRSVREFLFGIGLLTVLRAKFLS